MTDDDGMATVRRISALLDTLREVRTSDDPAARAAYFAEKAAVFDEIAARHPWQADKASGFADKARADALAARDDLAGTGAGS
jgi:hypothetical protein